MIELNRSYKILNRLDYILTVLCALFLALFISILNVEENMSLVMIPLNVYLLIKLIKFIIKNKLNIWNYPFCTFFICSTSTMLIINSLFIFIFGWNTQFTEIGFGSM